MHTIEVPEGEADHIAEMLSINLDKEHSWYADFKNEKYHYVVYRNKVFRVDLQNPVLYKEVKDYGLSIGIPEHQVDFAPEDKIWKR